MKIWGNDGREDVSRNKEIVSELRKMISGEKLAPDFKIVDIAAGNAKLLAEIKEEFTDCTATALDIEKFHEWDSHPFTCIKEDLKDFIKRDDTHYDVVLMLNSYRNWQGAGKEEFDRWVQDHAKYFITSLNGRVIGADTFDHPMVLFDIHQSK